jgi:hypothetical protein
MGQAEVAKLITAGISRLLEEFRRRRLDMAWIVLSSDQWEAMYQRGYLQVKNRTRTGARPSPS